MGNVLGVEIGGTKLQVGIGPQNGLPLQILRRQVVIFSVPATAGH